MTKRVLAIVAALWFFRILDASGAAAATLYALVMLAACGLCDGAATVVRKARGAMPAKGGRA